MEKLDNLVGEYIEQRLLQPKRLEQLLSHVLDRRNERAERRKLHIAELRERATEADARLKRFYDAIENGIADLSDRLLGGRLSERQVLACPVLYVLPERRVTVHSGDMGYTMGPFARRAKCPGRSVS
jgi:hypothetical protein